MNIAIIVFYVVIIGAMMYFMAIKPQKKEQKRQQELMDSMEIGDYVLTTSGFYGVLIDISEDDVIVEFGKEEKTLNSKTDFDYVIPYDNWLKTLDVTRVYNQITREVASITVNDVPVEGTLTNLNGANNVVKEANGIELSNYIVDTVSHAHGHGHGHGSGNAGGGIVVPE